MPLRGPFIDLEKNPDSGDKRWFNIKLNDLCRVTSLDYRQALLSKEYERTPVDVLKLPLVMHVFDVAKQGFCCLVIDQELNLYRFSYSKFCQRYFYVSKLCSDGWVVESDVGRYLALFSIKPFDYDIDDATWFASSSASGLDWEDAKHAAVDDVVFQVMLEGRLMPEHAEIVAHAGFIADWLCLKQQSDSYEEYVSVLMLMIDGVSFDEDHGYDISNRTRDNAKKLLAHLNLDVIKALSPAFSRNDMDHQVRQHIFYMMRLELNQTKNKQGIGLDPLRRQSNLVLPALAAPPLMSDRDHESVLALTVQGLFQADAEANAAPAPLPSASPSPIAPIDVKPELVEHRPLSPTG